MKIAMIIAILAACALLMPALVRTPEADSARAGRDRPGAASLSQSAPVPFDDNHDVTGAEQQLTVALGHGQLDAGRRLHALNISRLLQVRCRSRACFLSTSCDPQSG